MDSFFLIDFKFLLLIYIFVHFVCAHSVSLKHHDESDYSAVRAHCDHDPVHADTDWLSLEESPSKGTQSHSSWEEIAEDEHEEVQGNKKNLQAVWKGNKGNGIRSYQGAISSRFIFLFIKKCIQY